MLIFICDCVKLCCKYALLRSHLRVKKLLHSCSPLFITSFFHSPIVEKSVFFLNRHHSLISIYPDCRGRFGDCRGRLGDWRGRFRDCRGRFGDCRGRFGYTHHYIPRQTKDLSVPLVCPLPVSVQLEQICVQYD